MEIIYIEIGTRIYVILLSCGLCFSAGMCSRLAEQVVLQVGLLSHLRFITAAKFLEIKTYKSYFSSSYDT